MQASFSPFVSLCKVDLAGKLTPLGPQVLFLGLQHAREWIAGMTVMYIVERLLWQSESDGTVADLLTQIEIVAIPVVNPDGCASLSTLLLV